MPEVLFVNGAGFAVVVVVIVVAEGRSALKAINRVAALCSFNSKMAMGLTASRTDLVVEGLQKETTRQPPDLRRQRTTNGGNRDTFGDSGPEKWPSRDAERATRST